MALGFYEQRVNGISAVGHGGDLNNAHAYMWLIPSENVGVYVVMNSAGVGSDSFDIRLSLFQAFGDRYFPAPAQALVELPTARVHARMLAGNYSVSRASTTNFIDAANFLYRHASVWTKTGARKSRTNLAVAGTNGSRSNRSSGRTRTALRGSAPLSRMARLFAGAWTRSRRSWSGIARHGSETPHG